MITCNQCGFEQDEGKFCGKCGNSLNGNVQAPAAGQQPIQHQVATPTGQQHEQHPIATPAGQQHVQHHVETAADQEYAAPVNTNDSMEKVKEKSRAFGNYFKLYVKRPSFIFTNKKDEFTNGMISIVLVAILMALSAYTLISNFSYGYGPSFLTIFGNVVFFSLVLIAIIVSALFIINKLFGSDLGFKQMVSVFGAHLAPVIIVAGLAFILIIIKSNTFGSIMLAVTLILILTTIPVYLISSLLTRNSKSIDPLYGYILYLVVIGIAFSIFISMLADSMIGNIWDELFYYF